MADDGYNHLQKVCLNGINVNNNGINKNILKNIYFKVDFRIFAKIAIGLPLGSLCFCFFSAIIFNYSEVNYTVCNKTHLVPSISAVTGVSPQKYVWRVCNALNSTPRFIVGMIYYRYNQEKLTEIKSSWHTVLQVIIQFTFWIYIMENCCLIGVTYIANTENYPLHEKIFVFFMIFSILHQILSIILFSQLHQNMYKNTLLYSSYKLKLFAFTLTALSTVGLLIAYYYHRFYCLSGAFSIFSTCEFIIAAMIIIFHYTASYELKDLEWFGAIPFAISSDNMESTQISRKLN